MCARKCEILSLMTFGLVPDDDRPIQETMLMSRKTVELVREGKYAVEVHLIVETDGGSIWPRLEARDKLQSVRLALQRGDLAEAAKYGQVFELVPVST